MNERIKELAEQAKMKVYIVIEEVRYKYDDHTYKIFTACTCWRLWPKLLLKSVNLKLVASIMPILNNTR